MSEEVNGYQLSRNWWNFVIPKLSKLYSVTNEKKIDGRTYNEFMQLISRSRRQKIVRSDVAYMLMRFIDKKYMVYIDNKDVKRKRRRYAAVVFTANPEVREKVLSLHGKECLCCGVKENIELDHVVPVARGGEDKIENLQPLCRGCNSRKSTKIIDYR